MIRPRMEKSPTQPPRRAGVRVALVIGALALSFLTSACDKCGDWPWDRGAKTCHDESQLK
jgi:hypothetical protein